MLICSIGDKFKTQKTGVKKFILKFIWNCGKVIGYKKLQKILLKSAKKTRIKQNKYLGCRVWTCHLYHEVFEKRIFDEVKFINLRDKTFPIFKEYEIYLNELYGEWRLELPPEKQHSNHNIEVWWKDGN